MYDSLDNEALLARALGGEAGAYEAAYARFAPLVLLSASKLVEVADAQEVAAHVMSKLLAERRGGARAPIDNVAGYLYAAARNAALRLLKNRARRSAQHEAYAANIFSSASVESEPEERLTGEAARQRHARLYAAIDQLSPAQRECLTLFYFADYSYRDIARITDRPDKQVKSAIQNGKIRLFNLLKHSAA